ncbi:secA translation cis-regulator SecM [Moellerella wisconsensis]|uniref:secA translation cis-regulator SecM n=1 Tax=Moellerella wisconsensis TaxID=158849 RepID=UPI0006410E5E|nr:secA translation cis-regulator SecM [Moellerella wisconsensis]KLN96539.1 SecA regulator SecM [Moellerella wisconsensis]
MGIVSLWRQFGRRYFWPHLLLGVVAAGIGMPAILSALVESHNIQINASVAERQTQAMSAFDNLFAQKSNQRPSSSYSINYWQQHAVRNVIRQLTFAFSSLESEKDEPAENDDLILVAQLEPQIMLDTLYAMLAQRSLQYIEPTFKPFNIKLPPDIACQPAMWVSQTQGIRAGPKQV